MTEDQFLSWWSAQEEANVDLHVCLNMVAQTIEGSPSLQLVLFFETLFNIQAHKIEMMNNFFRVVTFWNYLSPRGSEQVDPP